MLRIGIAAIGAACLLLSAGPAAATSHLPDSIIEFTRQAQIEGDGIDIRAGYGATETAAGDFLLPVFSVAGGNVDHLGSTIDFVTSTTRVALEDWFYDMTSQIVSGRVIWHEGFGSQRMNQFVGSSIPLFDVFPQSDGTFVLELRDELADIFQSAFGDDGTLFPAGFRFAIAQFPAKPVPEPALGAVLGAGLVAVAALARGRRRRQA